jgi:hypothetical protein
LLALADHTREKLFVILLVQPLTQEHERRKVQAAGREERVNDRKAPSESGGNKTPKGFAFAESELFYAEFEHR